MSLRPWSAIINGMKTSARLLSAFSVLALSSLGSGCLKSRVHLREESENAPQSVPAQVQEVEPKGQYVIDELRSEITRLTGKIEELERQQNQAHQKEASAQGEEAKKLEKRVSELETAQAAVIEQLKKLQNAALQASVDPAELFEKGRKQLTSGDLEGSIESFTNYLKSPKAKAAEDATFLRGEALYELKQYNRAIADYAQFPEKFTRSPRMPQALYKIGMSFLALQNKSDARAFFTELIEKFPKSPEAKKARSKLAGRN